MAKYHKQAAELSWLSFNRCILQEASDQVNPLYERIKFLAIHSSNLDEFYRVKVKKLLQASDKRAGLLKTVHKVIHRQQLQLGAIWKDEIVPELAENNIIYYESQPIKEKHIAEIEQYFRTVILSYIHVTRISRETNETFFLNNRQLYLFIKLKEQNCGISYAYINIPSDKINRYRILSGTGPKYYIISIDTIIKKNLHHIFKDDKVLEAYAIKLNRDENYQIEDETTGNLAAKIKQKINERKAGSSTRFLYDSHMSRDTVSFCKSLFALNDYELFKGGSHHNFYDLFKFPNPGPPHFENPAAPGLGHPAFDTYRSVFESVMQENRLLHFPYQSYHYILQFFNEAAIHKEVSEISITLYRVSSRSLIINALMSAARNGKKVTVFVEVKARFDEDNNLRWAREMKKAGVKIIYSLPGVKVHAKIAFITFSAKSQLKSLSYLSTGNFNESTAVAYSDFGFFTSDTRYTDDLQHIFDFLKGKDRSRCKISYLWVAGFNFKEKLIRCIETEIQNRKKGRPAAIFIKANGLDEKEVINKLAEAGRAGVEITLLIRGICTLLPQPGETAGNIKIYRIVDRYLEHSRIYRFSDSGNERVYLSSADMMDRNLNRRIEVAFPFTDSDLIAEINHIIMILLADNTKKRTVLRDGSCEIRKEAGAVPRRAQTEIYEYYKQMIQG